ncbi:MAG: hypothetical protein KF806_02145 [Nitrospira sp.]|nr:hypothetical protein [Nitrospira sp.]
MNAINYKGASPIYWKAFLILLMIGSLFNIGGCVAIGHGTYSWPTFVGESQKDEETEYPVVELPGIKIQVVPRNRDSFDFIGPLIPLIPVWQHEDGAKFWIGVRLDPQAQEFVFDPFKVTVEIDGGKHLIPDGFTGPFIATKEHPKNFCSESLEPKNEIIEHVTFRVTEETCFGIAYNIITPKPDINFEVLIGGLEQKEGPMNVPRIKFEKIERRGWSFCLSESVCTDHWTMTRNQSAP